MFHLNLTKISKVGIWGGSWVGGVVGWGEINMGPTLHVFRFSFILQKVTCMQNFINIGQQL